MPKSEGRKKPEIRRPNGIVTRIAKSLFAQILKRQETHEGTAPLRISGFEILSDLGFRDSDFSSAFDLKRTQK